MISRRHFESMNDPKRLVEITLFICSIVTLYLLVLGLFLTMAIVAFAEGVPALGLTLLVGVFIIAGAVYRSSSEKLKQGHRTNGERDGAAHPADRYILSPGAANE